MNIFELAELSDEEACVLVERTLSSRPELRRLYDEEFVRLLVRRWRLDNFLLLQLARWNDRLTLAFWQAIIDDLDLLAGEGAWTSFHDKLRHHARFDLESALSELAMAAWMKRRGVDIIIEPPTRNRRICEFSAETTPKTWWEIKAIHDLDFLVEDEAVATDVQSRLAKVDEPYVLTLKESTVTRDEVAAAVKDVKRQIGEHYASRGGLPKTFEARGLVVEASGPSKKPYGYLGMTVGGLHSWTDEYAEKVAKRISSAAEQLPDCAAGIVVIDTTMSTWIHRDDIIDACFGVESLAVIGNRVQSVRGRGAFKPGALTRISAVIHYTRFPGSDDAGLGVIHNPYASVPLGDSVLSGTDVKQTRRVSRGNGRFALETT